MLGILKALCTYKIRGGATLADHTLVLVCSPSQLEVLGSCKSYQVANPSKLPVLAGGQSLLVGRPSKLAVLVI